MTFSLVEIDQKNRSSVKKDSLTVGSLHGDRFFVERLQELGIHAGAQLSYLGRAPLSGPFLFQLGGTVIALRQEEAQCIQIQIKL